MKTLLLPAQLLPVSRCLNLFKSRLHPTFIHRLLGTKMATASTAAQLTISLPCQLNEPVIVEPAPGVSDSDFSLASSTFWSEHPNHANLSKHLKVTELHRELPLLVDLIGSESTYTNMCAAVLKLYTWAGISVHQMRIAVESTLFKQWLKNIQTETGMLANGAMTLKSVLIQGIDMFGSCVGFLKFRADVIDKETGKKVPGIVFARGPAVAVLILLDSDGETYAVLTEQVRVPVGKLILELPAGMLDEDKDDIVGTAVREVEEETGIQLKLDDVIDLTAFLDPSTGCRVFPSPGGCDEDLGLFLYRASVGKDIITELSGKQTGLRDHGELIRVHVVPYKNLWRMTADAKVLMAIALYEMAKRDGLLPPLQDFSTAI